MLKYLIVPASASTMRAATQPRQLLVLFSLVGAILTARTADGFPFPAGQPASLPDSTQVGT